MEETKSETPRFYRLGEVVIDRETRSVFRDGTAVKLEPRVFDVLEYLAGQGGREVPRSELIAKVWRGTHVVDEAVHRAISHLRAALGDAARAPVFLLTTPTPGYRLLQSVEGVSGASAAPRTVAGSGRRNLAVAFGVGALTGMVAALLLQALRPEPLMAPPAPPVDPAAPTDLIAPPAPD